MLLRAPSIPGSVKEPGLIALWMVSRARHSSKRRCGSGGPWLLGSLSLVHGCARACRVGARRAGPMSVCGVA